MSQTLPVLTSEGQLVSEPLMAFGVTLPTLTTPGTGTVAPNAQCNGITIAGLCIGGSILPTTPPSCTGKQGSLLWAGPFGLTLCSVPVTRVILVVVGILLFLVAVGHLFGGGQGAAITLQNVAAGKGVIGKAARAAAA